MDGPRLKGYFALKTPGAYNQVKILEPRARAL